MSARLRKQILLFMVLAGLVVPGLTACAGVGESNDSVGNPASPSDKRGSMQEAQKKPATGPMNPRLVSANTEFGFDLFKVLTSASDGRNVFFSPASVGLALAMTYNGAEGETRQAMAQTLALQGLSLEDVNQAYNNLRSALESADPKVKLEIANSLWANNSVKFKQDFISRNREYYGAEVEELDFGDPGSLSRINSWVSENTGGKIDKIIDRIEPDAILFLINAIYFKGSWSVEFEKEKTKEAPFTTSSDNRKKLPMMSQSGKFRYFEDKTLQAISLPYGGGRVSMYIFLPRAGMSLADFVKNLKAEQWDAWMSEFQKTSGEIILPRYRLEYEASLNDALKALGMGVAFAPDQADFSNMIAEARGNAFISQVKHKAYVEVNEEGTEAAAATSVGISVTSLQVERPPFRMVVDHPFFCAIRDNDTGTILFMGAVTDPQ